MSMKKIFLFAAVFVTFTATAQNVGVGTNAPHPSAKLDISANLDPNARGLLIPQMNLATAGFPAPGPATSLLVYNTNAGFGGGIGYFYNEGTPASPVWRRISVSSNTVGSVTASSPLVSSGGLTPNITLPQATGLVDGFLDNADWVTFFNKVSSVSSNAPLTLGGTAQNPVVTMPQATTGVDGFLSGTDWATFNSKIGSVTAIAPLVVGGTLPNRTISMPFASISTDGYLTSAGWNLFNNKVTAVAATAPLTLGGTVQNPTLGIGQATGSANGFLSSTDWNTFNNKVTTVAVTAPLTLGGTAQNPVIGLGPGSGNYIQNQNSSAQAANFWINGNARANDVRWGNSLLVNDQGGSIELGGNNLGSGVPFIDFHYNGSNVDYDVRIQNTGVDNLLIDGADLRVNGVVRGRIKHVSGHNHAVGSFFDPGGTGFSWWPAWGGEGVDDNNNTGSALENRRNAMLMPYNGRVVKVIVRVGNGSSGGGNEVVGRLAFDRNGAITTDLASNVVLDQSQQATYTCPTSWTFNAGDRILLGVNVSNSSAGNFGFIEDNDYYVTIVWEFDQND